MPFPRRRGKIAAERGGDFLTDEMLSRMLSDVLGRWLDQNNDKIINGLRSALPNGKQIDPGLERLLIAAIQISTQASMYLTIRTLEQSGILSLPSEGTPILYPLEEN